MRRKSRRVRRTVREVEQEAPVEESQEQQSEDEPVTRRRARVFAEEEIPPEDEPQEPRRRRRIPVAETEDEPESVTQEDDEPEEEQPRTVSRRRRVRQKSVEVLTEPAPEPESVEKDEAPSEDEEEPEPEEEQEEKPIRYTKKGYAMRGNRRVSAQEPRKIVGPELHQTPVDLDASPQQVTIRQAEPDEIIELDEPLLQDAEDETPVMDVAGALEDYVPAKNGRRRKPQGRSIQKDVPEEEDDAPLGPVEVGDTLPVILTSDQMMAVLCSLLDRSYSLSISKVGNRYVINRGDKVFAGTGSAMTKKQADEEAESKEYKAFNIEWSLLSDDEKLARAKNADPDKDWDSWDWGKWGAEARIRRVVMNAEGIEHWKPEYRSTEARERLWKEGIYAKPF